MQIEDTREAPQPLALIQAIVNTRYGQKRPDDWKSPEQLHGWLLEHQLLQQNGAITQGDLRRMIDMREALRSLLHSNNGGEITGEPLATLNHLAPHAPLIVHFRPDGQAELVAGSKGLDGIIAHLLSIVFTAIQNGTWARLKACRNELCTKAFYDSSKNGSGTWCSMARCGSRTKARTYRRRRAQSEQ